MRFETEAGHCTGMDHLTYDGSMRYDNGGCQSVVAIDSTVARVAPDTVILPSSRSSLWSVIAVALRTEPTSKLADLVVTGNRFACMSPHALSTATPISAAAVALRKNIKIS